MKLTTEEIDFIICVLKKYHETQAEIADIISSNAAYIKTGKKSSDVLPATIIAKRLSGSINDDKKREDFIDGFIEKVSSPLLSEAATEMRLASDIITKLSVQKLENND